MVERLVANEKVEGSTPFARSNFVIKQNVITYFFQWFIKDKDIRSFKNSYFYYIFFRLIRNFLNTDIILNIFGFKVLGSVNKNNTSYFLLKKCDFGDNKELNLIRKISNLQKILFIDCGCNYGFYSLYVASLSNNNKVISIEASKKTLTYFKKNLKLNLFLNIVFFNKAISNRDNKDIIFYESEKDWESSVVRKNFFNKKKKKIKTIKIDTIVNQHGVSEFYPIIKLDVEGNEIDALRGSLNFIKKKSPLIIIEFSKFTLNSNDKIEFLNFFLKKFKYSIFDTNYQKHSTKDILFRIDNLKKRFMTIGNFYIVHNSNKIFKNFNLYE